MGSLKRAFQAVWALAALLVLPATLACGGGHSSPPPPTPPSITTQPASQTVLEGATATFSVVAAGSTPLTYQWNKVVGTTSTPITTNGTSASYTTPATVLADSGSSFTVTVTNSAGNVTSSAATLTVYPNPTVTSFTATPATITVGNTATLAFAFSGGTGSIDNGVGTVTSGTNVTVTPTTTTTYTLTVDNGHSTTKTATATVTVVPAPAAPTITAPANVTLGGTYTASVVAQAGMTYTWTATNGTITAGQGTNQITFTAGASGTAMSLRCVVANAAGATASGSMNMTMVMAPVATSLTPSTATPLYGATVNLVPVFTGGIGSVDNGIGTVMSGTSYTTAALKAATTFTLTVTNMAGTTATATTTVTPQTVAVSVSPTAKTVTTGDVVTFTGSAANAVNTAVTWTASGGASITSAGVWTAPSTPGSYTVTATSVADPTKSATATMTVAPAPVQPTITAPAFATAAKPGYTASVTAQTGMTYAWTITNGTITAGGTTNQITYTAGAAGTPLTLICIVTNAANFPATSPLFTETVVPLPTVAITASNTSPLYGDTTVTVTPTFSNDVSASVGTTSGAITTSPVSGTPVPVQSSGFVAAETYRLTAVNAAGDTAQASVAITPQTVGIGIPTGYRTIVTTGDTVTFSATVTGAVNTSVTWTATAGSITAAGVWTAPPSPTASCTITATSVADPTHTASTFPIAVVAPPDAAITATPNVVAVGATGLTASVPTQTGATYAWTLANGTGSGSITSATNGPSITYSALTAGTFSLNVSVTNAAGMAAGGSAPIQAVVEPYINAFSASSTNVVSGTAVTLNFTFGGGTGVITASDASVTQSVTSPGTLTVTPATTPSVTYTLTVTGGSGTTPAVQTVTVNVSTPLTFTTNLPTSGTANVGTNYTMSVVVGGTPAANSFDWYFNGSKVATTTTPSYTLINVQPINQGPYYVIATNGIATATSATLTLTVSSGYAISGHVYRVNSGNTGVAGVQVVLSQGTTTVATVNTDSAGAYSFPFLANGTYTVTPSLSTTGVSAGFLPASYPSVVVNGSNVTADFQAAIGYSVSGTVSYSGSQTGRVYVIATSQYGQVNSVSVASATSSGTLFTIRGLAPGNWTLTAYMDPIGLGNANANDPSVASPITFTIASTPVSGYSLNLVDPAAVTLSTAPSFNGIKPFSTGALVNYQPLMNGSKVETPTSYDVQWSTSSSFATVAGTLTFPAQGDHNPMCFVHGLTDGTPYYFQIRGNVGATHGSWSAASSVTPGATTGAYTVSGTITLPVTPTGPLAVALVDKASNKFFITWFQTPSATQSFTLAGVPAGTYGLYGILDQNNNGIIDTGDLSNTGSNGASVVVTSANVTGANLTLSGANAVAVLNTQYWQQTGTYTGSGYQLNFRVNGNVKLPVNAAVNFGTAANPAWVDMGLGNQGDRYSYWTQWIQPKVGDAFPLQLGYSDGTSETPTVTVTGVLTAFAQNLAPVAPTSTGTTPTFSWTAPATLPTVLPYTYEVGVWQSGSTIWYISGLPSTQTSVTYNSDGQANPTSLTTGITYQWAVNVVDADGNSAQYTVDYKP